MLTREGGPSKLISATGILEVKKWTHDGFQVQLIIWETCVIGEYLDSDDSKQTARYKYAYE